MQRRRRAALVNAWALAVVLVVTGAALFLVVPTRRPEPTVPGRPETVVVPGRPETVVAEAATPQTTERARPTPVEVESGPRLERIARERHDVVRRSAGVFWVGRGLEYEIERAIDSHSVVVSTSVGPVAIPAAIFDADQEGPPETLSRLIEAADKAGFKSDALEAAETRLTGIVLTTPSHLVLTDGVLEAQSKSALEREWGRWRSERRAELQQAAVAFVDGLGSAPLDRSSKAATAQILASVAMEDGAVDSYATLEPSVARRLIRHGWLTHLEADAAQTDRLTRAARDAAAMRPTELWEGECGHLAAYEDAYGNWVCVLVTPSRSAYLRHQPDPKYGDAPARAAVIDVEAGSDPINAPVRPRAATVFMADTEVAWWDPVGGLRVDGPRWRMPPAKESRRPRPGNWLPPHLLLTDPLGDALGLVTVHGAVGLVNTGSPEDTSRFLTDAARALPDAAHLDLIGELLYDYAWDSAEYRRPLLVGTQTHNGDWVQTAAQTLATCAGGRYRGDCDDLADFYHAIAVAQGRNAHVMSLPWHLACAWADENPGGGWSVSVVHTGSPLVFEQPTIPEALESVYAHFDAAETIDTNALPVALRFEGEGQRRTYYLSHRIFGDPNYARDLIAVQHDLHAHTYLHGIETMQRVVEDPAHTESDEWELAQMFVQIGEPEEAAEAYRRALSLTKAPASRVELSIELLACLLGTGTENDIETLARTILETEIPELERVQEKTVVGPWIRAADVLLRRETTQGLALQVLDLRVRLRIAGSFDHIQGLVERQDFDPHWLHYGDNPIRVSNLRAFVRVGIRALALDRASLDPSGRYAWSNLDTDVCRWFDRIAFESVEPHESRLGLYALLAQFHAVHLGSEAYRERVEAAPFPVTQDVVHSAEAGSRKPSRSDLGWVRASPEYWMGIWMTHCTGPKGPLDVDSVVSAIRHQREAAGTATRLGHGHWTQPHQELAADLVLALVTDDADGTRRALCAIASRQDDVLNDTTAVLLGTLACHLELATFRHATTEWAASVDHRPHYFQIAWSAVRSGVPEHARFVARLAVAKHPDDGVLQSELERFEQRLAVRSPR